MSDDGRYVVWDDVGNDLMGFPSTGADAFTHTLFMRDLVEQKSYHVALDRFGSLPSFFGMCEYLSSPSFGAYFRTTIYPNCPSISGDGKTLAFSSYSDRWSENDLAPPRSLNDPDNNPRRFLDVFVGTLGMNQVTTIPAITPLGQSLLALTVLMCGLFALRNRFN